MLTSKSQSAEGVSHHEAFMVSSLTISQTRLPCPSCGKMGLQSWTMVVPKNQLSNLKLDRSWQYGGYVLELTLLKPRFDTAEMPIFFCLTATELACTNDGGDDKVMYCWRQLTLAEWEGLRMWERWDWSMWADCRLLRMGGESLLLLVWRSGGGGFTGKEEWDACVVRAVTWRPGNLHGMGTGWTGIGGNSTKSVCPVHLVDGYGWVSGRGGAEKIV